MAITQGAHHIGLAVRDVEETAGFFHNVLGWEIARRDPDYPAIFVSDGRLLVTLWQVRDPESSVPFDRRKNIGLHHLALRVAPDALESLHETLASTPGVDIEFGPEPLRRGPIRHMMCCEPGGLRIEFIALPG